MGETQLKARRISLIGFLKCSKVSVEMTRSKVLFFGKSGKKFESKISVLIPSFSSKDFKTGSYPQPKSNAVFICGQYLLTRAIFFMNIST